jgi:hypothetical protein
MQERHLQAEHDPLCDSGMTDKGKRQEGARSSKHHLAQEKSAIWDEQP